VTPPARQVAVKLVISRGRPVGMLGRRDRSFPSSRHTSASARALHQGLAGVFLWRDCRAGTRSPARPTEVISFGFWFGDDSFPEPGFLRLHRPRTLERFARSATGRRGDKIRLRSMTPANDASEGLLAPGRAGELCLDGGRDGANSPAPNHVLTGLIMDGRLRDFSELADIAATATTNGHVEQELELSRARCGSSTVRAVMGIRSGIRACAAPVSGSVRRGMATPSPPARSRPGRHRSPWRRCRRSKHERDGEQERGVLDRVERVPALRHDDRRRLSGGSASRIRELSCPRFRRRTARHRAAGDVFVERRDTS
jgi:hypothetical protein